MYHHSGIESHNFFIISLAMKERYDGYCDTIPCRIVSHHVLRVKTWNLLGTMSFPREPWEEQIHVLARHCAFMGVNLANWTIIL